MDMKESLRSAKTYI